MRLLKKILLLLLESTVLLLILYGLIKFAIIPFWEPILFYSYLIGGLLFVTIGRIKLNAINKVSLLSKDNLVDTFFKQKEHSNKVIVLRNFIVKIFSPLFLFSHWLSCLLIGISKKDIVESKGKYALMASLTITIPEHLHSIISFILVLFTAILIHIFTLSYNYHKYFITVLIIGVLLKELIYVFSTESLPEKLKKTLGSPYLKFFLLLLFDFLTLSLSFTLLKSFSYLDQISIPMYIDTCTGLFRLQKLQEFMSIGNLSVIDWFISIGGLIFYLSLFKSLLSFKQFKRSDIDLISIAGKYLRSGNFYLCQKWLSKVAENNSEKLLYDCVCYVGLNQIEKAYNCAKKKTTLDCNNPTIDEIFSNIYGSLLYSPVPLEYIVNLILYSIKLKISDARLTSSLIFIILSNELSHEKTALLNKIDFISDEYFLSLSSVLLYSDQTNKAIDLLNKIITKTSYEELLRIFLMQNAIILSSKSEDEMKLNFLNWLDEFSEKIKYLVDDLNNDWEKLSISSFVLGCSLWCKVFIPYREQEYKYLADLLLTDIDEKKYPKSITESLRSLSSQIEKEMGKL